MSKHTFVLSDENSNRYGFRVRTLGIQLENFRKNPVMLYMHKRGDEQLPIGHWENIRIEGTQLLADPVFDTDEFSQKIAAKVESGTLRAASAGLDPLEFDYLPGSDEPVLLRSEMREASIVDIPSNANCLKLYAKKKHITLGIDDTQRDEVQALFPTKPTPKPSMSLVAITLGLPSDSSESALKLAIEKLQREKNEAEQQLSAEKNQLVQLTAAKEDAEKKLKELQEAAVKKANREYVELAAKEGKISAKEVEPLVKLADSSAAGMDAVKELLEARKAYKSVSVQLAAQPKEGEQDKRKDWSFEDYMKKAPVELAAMKETNWEQYSGLFKAQYGVNPRKDA